MLVNGGLITDTDLPARHCDETRTLELFACKLGKGAKFVSRSREQVRRKKEDVAAKGPRREPRQIHSKQGRMPAGTPGNGENRRFAFI